MDGWQRNVHRRQHLQHVTQSFPRLSQSILENCTNSSWSVGLLPPPEGGTNTVLRQRTISSQTAPCRGHQPRVKMSSCASLKIKWMEAPLQRTATPQPITARVNQKERTSRSRLEGHESNPTATRPPVLRLCNRRNRACQWSPFKGAIPYSSSIRSSKTSLLDSTIDCL